MKLIDRIKPEIRSKINTDVIRPNVLNWLNKSVGPTKVPLEIAISIYSLLVGDRFDSLKYLKIFNK